MAQSRSVNTTIMRKPYRLTWALALLMGTQAAAQSDDLRIVEAMRKQDLATARALIAEGVGVNTQDASSATALHWAAHWGELEAVQWLLDAGADPNISNRFGVSPLHEAAIVANSDMLAALLDAGADPNARFGDGETVLMTAARTGNVAAVEIILEHGGLVNAVEGWHGQTALMWAALEGHADVVERLIASGADVNATSTAHDWPAILYSAGNTPKLRDIGGLTPLHFAARDGQVEAAEVLIAHGADASATEPMYQLTALQMAVVNGHYKLAKHLIDAGVAVNDGSLYLATDTRNLGHYPQRPNPPNYDDGFTHLDVIRMLLEHGADPDARYTKGIPERTVSSPVDVPEGATPLERAAVGMDIEVMRLLIEAGADPSVAAADGTTPLMLMTGHTRRSFGSPPEVAGNAERRQAIELLLEAGADVNAVHQASGNSAAHFAALRGAAEIVALLGEYGANLETQNRDGNTPADAAARRLAQTGD
jgi:ankyrin repeat protein